LQLSTGVQKRTVQALIAAAFTDAHAFAQLPGSPRPLWTPFLRTEMRVPVVLELKR
jgi:hypothetical protein